MRQSGRTTRMLLQAVIRLSEGKSPLIYIIGRTHDQIRMHLIPEFRRLCAAVNLPLEKEADETLGCKPLFTVIQFHTLDNEKAAYQRALRPGPTYTDHYAKE